MNWTYETPKTDGWYWVMYHGYEYVEVVLLSKGEVFCAGMKGCLNHPKEILKWSTSPLEMPIP
jgi:hypothetical protein